MPVRPIDCLGRSRNNTSPRPITFTVVLSSVTTIPAGTRISTFTIGLRCPARKSRKMLPGAFIVACSRCNNNCAGRAAFLIPIIHRRVTFPCGETNSIRSPSKGVLSTLILPCISVTRQTAFSDLEKSSTNSVTEGKVETSPSPSGVSTVYRYVVPEDNNKESAFKTQGVSPEAACALIPRQHKANQSTGVFRVIEFIIQSSKIVLILN